MQVITSSTLTLLHDGQFWVAICEHTEGERYGACRVVFGATEPSDTEVLSFVCARWVTLEFACTVDDGSLGAASLLAHPNPKRRQREAKKLVQHSGVGTKAQQAISAGYEARKADHKVAAREARLTRVEQRFALKQAKRKEKHRGH